MCTHTSPEKIHSTACSTTQISEMLFELVPSPSSLESLPPLGQAAASHFVSTNEGTAIVSWTSTIHTNFKRSTSKNVYINNNKDNE